MAATERYWHGGAPGLKPGDLITPQPSGAGGHLVDGCPTCEARKAGTPLDSDDNNPDWVYVTTDREYARLYAAGYPRGGLYQVEPVGEMHDRTGDHDPLPSWGRRRGAGVGGLRRGRDPDEVSTQALAAVHRGRCGMTEWLWHLEVPFADDGLPPLNANKQLHWAVRNRRVQEVKDAIGWRVREQKIPSQDHIMVRLLYQPQNRLRRDPSNLMPTQKAAVDGLVLAGVVPDDTPQFVTEEVPKVAAPDGGDRGLWLLVKATPPPLMSAEDRAAIAEDIRHERTGDALDRDVEGTASE